MLAPVLLHSAAGPLSAAASLPTPGPHRWQLLRATGRGPPPAGGGGGSRPALWAVPPAPSGLRAAPLPTLGGVPPPAPSIPLRGLAGVMWWPRPGPCGPRPGQVGHQPLHGGTPPQCKAKPLRGGPKARPCITPPPYRLRRRCSGAARPPLYGGCGAVRPSGPALRAGVAARGPSLGVPPPSRAGAPAAGCCCSPCPCGGPQSERRPLGPRKRGLCPHCGRLGRKDTPAAAGNATPANATQGQDKPPTAGLAWRSPARQGRKQGRAAPVAAHPTPHTPPKERKPQQKERKVTKMTIREYAKSKNFKIVGKLTRHPEWEWEWDKFSGEKRRSGTKSYSDDGGNVYHISKKGICIVTPNDEII